MKNSPAAKKNWPGSWAPKPNVSHSSSNRFDRCQWLYLLTAKPRELVDWLPLQQRIESSLTPWNAYAGQVVDRAITLALQHHFKHNEWPRDLVAQGDQLLRDYWKCTLGAAPDTRKGKSPEFGSTLIDRIYYEGDAIPKADRLSVRDRVRRCLTQFEGSDIRDFITQYPHESWQFPRLRPDDPIPWFRCGNTPVYASFDFVIHTDDVTIIFDWKTGKHDDRSDSSVRDQLHTYAEFAHVHWQAPLDLMSLIPVWLADEPMNWSPISVDLDHLDQLKRNWDARFEDIVHRVRRCEADPTLIELLFAKSTRGWICRGCSVHSCPSYMKAILEADSVREEPFRYDVDDEDW